MYYLNKSRQQEYMLRSTIQEHLLGAHLPGPTLNESLISEGLSKSMVKDAIQFVASGAAEYGLGGITLPAYGAGLAVGPTVETMVDAGFAAEEIGGAISSISDIGGLLGEYGDMWDKATAAYGTSLTSYYKALVKIVRSALNTIGKAGKDKIEAVAEKLQKTIEKLISRLVGSLKSGIKLVIPDASIGLAAAIAFEEALEALSENAYDLIAAGIKKVKMLKDFVSDPSIAIAFFKDVFKQVVELMYTAAEKLEDISWARALLAGGPVGAAVKKLGPTGLKKAAALIKEKIPTIVNIIDKVLTVLVPTAITAIGLFQILMRGDWKEDPEVKSQTLAASYSLRGNNMIITKKQLRRIIRESYYDEGGNYVTTDGRVIPPGEDTEELEPARYRSKDEAEDYAIDMVFGDGPSRRLGSELPWEVRIVAVDGKYALYAMGAYADRYKGEGKVIAAVPRGGSIRYGRQIG